MKHLVPSQDYTDGQQQGKMFVPKLFTLCMLQDTVILERGPEFPLEFWRHVCENLRIQWKPETAFRRQTEGQMEHMNASMQQQLKAFNN
jgi:hypothetical protein